MRLGSEKPSIEEVHLALLQALPDGLCFLNTAGAIQFWNDAAEAIVGFSIAEAVSASRATEVFFFSRPDGQPANLRDTSEKRSEQGFLRHKDGHSIAVTIRHIEVSGHGGAAMGTLHLFAISKGALPTVNLGRATPAWLRHQDTHTEAPPPHEAGRPEAVLMVKIDDFEEIERRLGPEASEKVIALVERTTANCLRTGDSCTRLPEGALVAFKHSPGKVAELAERVRALIQSARLHWWGEAVTITVSIGAAILDPHEPISEALLRAEDCAVAAHAQGGNRVTPATF